MKSTILLIYNLFIILGIVSAQKRNLKPFSIKSGIVEYSYSGNKVGKGTLYFDDYGMKSAVFIDAVEDGEKRKSWIVTTGDYQYMWNPDDPAEGMKLKNPIIDWAGSTSGEAIESHNESMYTKIGMEKSGTGLFLGKECKVLTGSMGKVLTWNGITMLLDLKITGTPSHEEATDIQINVPVAAKYFIIPKKIRFSEMPGL